MVPYLHTLNGSVIAKEQVVTTCMFYNLKPFLRYVQNKNLLIGLETTLTRVLFLGVVGG